jgi:periplasmic protein TonB
MQEFQASPGEVCGPVPFRFTVTWTGIYADFPETTAPNTALLPTRDLDPWNRPPSEAEIAWSMVVPKLHKLRPRRAIPQIEPASAAAPVENWKRFAGRTVTCSSAIVAAAILFLLLRTQPKPQPAPRPTPALASVPARAPEADPEPARKPEPVVIRKPRVSPPPVVETSPLKFQPAAVISPPSRIPVELAEPDSASPPPIPMGGFESSRVLTKVKPIYPEAATLAQVQGTVRLRAAIGKDGLVQSVELESGPAMLFQAASDAVRQWRFLPARLNGDPVEDVTHINVTFTLVK